MKLFGEIVVLVFSSIISKGVAVHDSDGEASGYFTSGASGGVVHTGYILSSWELADTSAAEIRREVSTRLLMDEGDRGS